ncbi:MAG: aminomethyl-transferring glycine dehydrogenase [Deltaproteobacteria bacterium HGW-Deltaproteobacteria-14]|jgi:glycine dehydrogenase subunit 1|nr:MAG: aminomethyl-transferring glycine dehydrogenase [Deltaproteobacteria bacterium HGW-Deltaproteobacteria-14]
MRYIPHTDADRAFMLDAIGVASVDELFATVPASLQLRRALEVPSELGEADLLEHMQELADRNRVGSRTPTFLGAGVYRHYVPSAISQLLLRGELYTAYTPYQPEISQGTLQIMFEFQTMISELLGMAVVNASLYDGSTAMAEAALMGLRLAKKKAPVVVVSQALHPEYRAVTRLYVESGGAQVAEVPYTATGVTDLAAAETALAAGASALIVGYPTFFGTLDDVARARQLCDVHGAILIVVFQEALSFGLLTPPGDLGADIVAGEGQSLGVAQSFGGPHLGLFAVREEHLRQMPGRIAGETVDSRGDRGFVLTMATREQHIRREKATSNICTNQGLMATAATMYMTLLGPDGLARVARACHLRARQLEAAVTALDGYDRWFDAPTFHELVIRTPRPAQAIVDALAARGVAAGVALGQYDPALDHALLLTATELTTAADIDALVAGLAAAAR